MSDDRLLAVSAIVVDENGAILLRKRPKEPDMGAWELFAGFVEPGERLEETVRRKLKNKAGIDDIQSITFTGHYYDSPTRHPDQYCIPLLFIAKVNRNDVHVEPGDENLRWFAAAEVPSLELALDNKQVLTDAGVPF